VPAIRIRGYEEADRRAIIELVKTVLFEIYGTQAESIEDLSRVKEEYLDNDGAFFVAEDQGEIAGVIAVTREKDGIARLRRMYVDRRYRRRGIGHRLLCQAVRFCQEQGYRKIILSTYPQMRAALALYAKHGFREFERNDRIFLERSLVDG